MRLSSHKAGRSAMQELPMTSMIDVVFLLLIFFMATSSFSRTERQLDPAIKVQKQAARGPKQDLEPAIIDVTRAAGGVDRFVYKVGGRELATDLQLLDLLEKFPNKNDGAFVRVHDDAPFAMAAAAIQVGKSAGFLAVSYVPANGP